MADRIHKVEAPQTEAEGLCHGFPYRTHPASAEGVSIHFWMGDQANQALASNLTAIASRHRDIVSATYSDGAPSGFWAHVDFG